MVYNNNYKKYERNFNMKRILFTAPCKAELVEAGRPAVTPGCAVVRVLVSSISSGTERANVSGEPTVSYDVSLEEATKHINFPRAGGYSTCGIVEEVGEGKTDLKPGDRVAMSWTTHNQYVSVPFNNIYKLPDSISDNAGALVHICTFPAAAVRKCRTEFGESAIVMGLGVLGLIAVKLLRVAGAVPIIAVDPNPERRAQALKFGADFALDPFVEGRLRSSRTVARRSQLRSPETARRSTRCSTAWRDSAESRCSAVLATRISRSTTTEKCMVLA